MDKRVKHYLKANKKIIPGEPIKYIEGEVKTATNYNWGIVGTILIDSEEYKFQIKKDLKLKNQIFHGLNISFKNGFCISNKEHEVVITDGKFGKVEINFNICSYFRKLENETKLITAKIIDIKEEAQSHILEVKPLLSFLENKVIKIESPDELNSEFVWYRNRIARIKIKRIRSQYVLKDIEFLPIENVWYKLYKLRKGNTKDLILFFDLIRKQCSLILTHYERIKQELIIIKGNISKVDLKRLKNMLFSKISFGDLRPPHNIIIPERRINEYFENIHSFLVKIKNIYNDNQTAESIIDILEFYCAEISLKSDFEI